MWAVIGTIINFTAGDILDLGNLDLGNDLSLNEGLSGYADGNLDIGLQVGNLTLPVVFELPDVDADSLGLDVNDLMVGLNNADWLIF